MNLTRFLMSASAVVLGAVGVFLLFVPDVALMVAGVAALPATMVIAQLIGVLYLGFAVLNWMSRGNTIGGIYARPLAVANVMHFASGAAVLVKALSRGATPAAFWILAAVYVVFALAFATLLWRDPVPRR